MLDIVTLKGKPRLLTERPLPGEPLVEKNKRELKFPVALLSKGLHVILESGHATVAQDKDSILESMGRNPGTGVFERDFLEKSLSIANTGLRSYFAVAAWPHALRQSMVQAMDLPSVLRKDINRSALEMSFATLDVTDHDIEDIAQGFSESLRSLSLGFEGCQHLSDTGVAVLAQETNFQSREP